MSAIHGARPVSKRVTISDAVWLFACTLCVCVIILLYRLPIASNRLYLSQSEYRFGSVTAGTEIRRVATVRNLHPWSVRVQSLRGDCGCTRAFVGKTEPFTLKPLEAIQVAATVDTTGKSGSVTQNVYIVTDDNPQGTPITLSGIVTPAQPKGN